MSSTSTIEKLRERQAALETENAVLRKLVGADESLGDVFVKALRDARSSDFTKAWLDTRPDEEAEA